MRLATDIDGTFLDGHHHITDATISTYLELQERGVTVVPATGRAMAATRNCFHRVRPDFVNQFKWFPGIYSHGAVVFGDTEQEVLRANYMSVDVVKRLIKSIYAASATLDQELIQDYYTICLFKLSGMTIDFESENFLNNVARPYEEWHDTVIGHRLDESEDEFTEICSGVTHLSITCHRSLIPGLKNKFTDIVASDSVLAAASLKVIIPIPDSVHFLPSQESKAVGLDILCAKYGWKASEFMSIGDSDNDMEMVAWSKFGVAMGNACLALRKIASAISLTNEENGWSFAIRKFLMPESQPAAMSRLESQTAFAVTTPSSKVVESETLTPDTLEPVNV